MRGSSKICFKGLKEENTVSCSTVPRVDDLFIDPACCFAALMSSKLHRIIVLSTVPAFATGIEGFLMDLSCQERLAHMVVNKVAQPKAQVNMFAGLNGYSSLFINVSF